MASAKGDVKFFDGNRVVEITMPQPNGLPAIIPLRAEGLEGMIRSLVQIRSEMLPAVPPEPTALGPRLETSGVPVGIDGATGQPALQIQHPGLGWLTVVLTPEAATELAESLAKAARLSARGQGSAN